MKNYRTPLDRVMTENGIKNIDLWNKIKISHKVDYSYICKIRKGDKIPGRILAPYIEKALDGAISLKDLMYPEDYS